MMSSDRKYIYYCNSIDSIQEIEIPETVEYIFNHALSGKKYLKNIFVNSGSTVYSSLNGVLVSSNLEELIAYPTGRLNESFTIPSEIKIIKEKSIESDNLKILVVHDNVTKIEYNALSSIPNLESLTIPFIGTDINSSQKWISVIFGGGTNDLNNKGINNGKYLPKNLDTINITREVLVPEYAFYNASNLQTIYINSSVTLNLTLTLKYLSINELI